MLPRLCFFVIILIVSFACKPMQQVVDKNPPVAVPDEEPKVIFLNFLLNGNTKYEVTKATLVNQILSPGQLKRVRRQPDQVASPGDILSVFADAEGDAIKEVVYRNPLQKDIEFADENGRLASKKEKLAEVQFSVRAQLPPGSHFVLIKKLTPGKSKLLLKSKIETR